MLRIRPPFCTYLFLSFLFSFIVNLLCRGRGREGGGQGEGGELQDQMLNIFFESKLSEMEKMSDAVLK